jgi:hypothetical protein
MTQPRIENAMLALIFLGMIPGTSISIPSWIMFLVSIVGIVTAVRWISGQPLFIGSREYQEKLARQLARKKVLAMTAAPVQAEPQVKPQRINAVNRRRIAKA